MKIFLYFSLPNLCILNFTSIAFASEFWIWIGLALLLVTSLIEIFKKFTTKW